MIKLKIAINGFGRIGRIFFRQAFDNPNLEIAAINDLGTPENLAYLLKYDTVYGNYEKEVGINDGNFVIDGKKIKVFQEKEPFKLPWKDLDIDVVVESTGVFDSYELAKAHLDAGAKRVVITAPAKDEITPHWTPGLKGLEDFTKGTANNIGLGNFKKGNIGIGAITSNASCTTNAVNPVMAIMSANPGVKKALLTTIHGYTATQGLVDGPDKKGDFRRARAAAQNIVPSTTGAALATVKSLPELAGKFDGLAIRVPVISGSLIDITFVSERPTSVEEINEIFKKAASEKEWQGILTVTEDPIVSSDILRNPHGSIVDLALTRVVDGDLVKIFSWYDNEWGYGSMLLKHIVSIMPFI